MITDNSIYSDHDEVDDIDLFFSHKLHLQEVI